MIDHLIINIGYEFFAALLDVLLIYCYHLIVDGVPKEGLRILDVLVRIAVLLLIRDKVSMKVLSRVSIYPQLLISSGKEYKLDYLFVIWECKEIGGLSVAYFSSSFGELGKEEE